MANTLIQIKRSSSTEVPSKLNIAEPAYSYTSNVLWIGTTDNNGVIPIGGKYYTNLANQSFNIALTAYDKANTANLFAYNISISSNSYATSIGAASNSYFLSTISGANTAVGAGANAFTSATIAGANSFASATIAGANTAVGTGANSFTSATIAGANTAVGTGANTYLLATISGANTAVGAGANSFTSATIAGANTAVGTGANTYLLATIAGSNTAVGTGANAFTSATISGSNTAVGTGANTIGISAFTKANTVNLAAGSAYDSENITRAIAVAAYVNANSKFSTSGGTINGDVNISGNLTLTGNTTFINVSTYRVDDPLIYLAGNNYTSDIVDIGFVGNYNNGACSTLHTGVFRDAGTKEWYIFENYSKEPENNVIDPNGNNFTISVLNAVIKTSNVILNGINVQSWIIAAYNQANNTGAGSNASISQGVVIGTDALAKDINGNSVVIIGYQAAQNLYNNKSDYPQLYPGALQGS